MYISISSQKAKKSFFRFIRDPSLNAYQLQASDHFNPRCNTKTFLRLQ